MYPDFPEYEEADSGLYKYCSLCGKDILLLQTFDTDDGEICGDCYNLY